MHSSVTESPNARLTNYTPTCHENLHAMDVRVMYKRRRPNGKILIILPNNTTLLVKKNLNVVMESHHILK